MGYFAVCIAPITMIASFVAAVFEGFQKIPVWVYWGLGLSVAALILAVIYLRRLKLEITSSDISFHTLFRTTKTIAFNEVSTIVLISHDRVALQSSNPGGAPGPRKLIITPKTETGKATIRVHMPFFDSSVEEQLIRILEPTIWPD
jgi:hypothetical protein